MRTDNRYWTAPNKSNIFQLLNASIDVTRADWQTAFITSVVNADARKEVAFRAAGGASCAGWNDLNSGCRRSSQMGCQGRRSCKRGKKGRAQ